MHINWDQVSMGDLFRNLVTYIAARAIPAVMSLLFTIVCVESLTPAEYGTFTLTLLPVLIAAAFAGGLAGQPMLRFATVLSATGKKIGLSRAPLCVSLTLVPILLCYMIGFGHPVVLTVMSLGLVPLMALLDTRRNYLVALSRVKGVFLLDAVRSIVSIVMLVGLVGAGMKNSKAPLLAMLTATAVSLIVFSTKRDRQHNYGTAQVDRAYLLYGFWVACWLAVISTFPFLERLFLSWRYDMSVAGTYSMIADPLAAVASASGSVIVSAFMPKYVSAWTEQRQTEIHRLNRIAVFAVVLIACATLAVGLVIAIAGIGKYAQILRTSPGLGLWLLVASAIWQASVFLHKPLELRSQTRNMFLCLVIAAVAFVIIATPLVNAWGVAGIAMAKVLAGIIYTALVIQIGRNSKVSS